MKVFFGAIIVLTGLLLSGVRGESTLRKAPELAFAVPHEGQKLLSQYRGKVVALEFILTTCPHCQAATKVMNGMQEQYGSRGLQVIDVAIDPGADSLVSAFAKTYQTVFPVGSVSLDQMMSFMGFTERPVVPQLVLIDRNGFIRYQTPRTGDSESMKEDVIRQRIEELTRLDAQTKTTRVKRSQRG